MKWVFLTPVVFLLGCGTQVFFYKDGEAKEVVAQDLAACEAEALEKAPVDLVEDDFDVAGLGEKRLVFVPAAITTRDANLGLRARLERSCMADKGYTRLQLERCDESVASVEQTVLPPASDVACYVKNADRSVTFVAQ